jgi:NAD/NADP transhydrogenase beta subunit
MEAHVTGTRRSPAQLYALIFGAVLTIAGIIGFFYNSEFTSNKHVHDAVFGILSVNGWHNVFHILTGVLGLVVASSYSSARGYALGFGFVYIIIAIWGFIIGSGDSILSIIPVNTEDNVLHLFIGLAGIAAGVATPAVADPTTRPVST